MIAISLRFLAGRFHATPWGRHVNEGAVEWPPSPWRILRALVAAWKRTLPELGRDRVEPILRALAAAPEFILPPASTGHTRHFMPWFKKGPSDRTLVFDTFTALAREDPVHILWPEAFLDSSQRDTLGAILGNLGTLGRSESWCEATLLSDEEAARLDAAPGRRSAPLDGQTPSEGEIVRILCPDPKAAFASDHAMAATGNRGGRRAALEEPSPRYDPPWNLCMETLQLHQEQWSDPPGSRWVRYVRPRDCFKIEPGPRGVCERPRIQVARFALDSTVLPIVTETLHVAESARRALMSLHGRLTEKNGVKGKSGAFSGKDENGAPLAGHTHAYYLPTDEDGDGRLDRLTVCAAGGFGQDEMRAIDRLREIRTAPGEEPRHPLRVLLMGMGMLDDHASGPLGASRIWVSATPYLAARHAKTRGRHRIDTRTPEARARFLAGDLARQLAAVRSDWGEILDSVRIEPLLESGAFKIAGRWRPIQFRRFRRKTGDDGGRRLAGAFQIEFAREVRGPIALGWSSHFGMGLFVPRAGNK